MDKLPEEILQEIGLYLKIKDVLNCNLVCPFWRNAFNLNKIWSILCHRHFAIQLDQLPIVKPERNRVLPSFKSPKNDFPSKFSDLCPWRLRYMQEIHITKNWKTGRFKNEVIIHEESSDDLKRMERDDLLCDDQNLVVYFFKKHLFRVWELSQKIKEKQSIPCSLSSKYVIPYFNLYKGTLVIVQGNLLHVFKRDGNCDFILKFRFLLTEELKESEKLPAAIDITNWYEREQKEDINYKCFDHNCTYFIAVIQNTINKVQVHIFNIEEGIKYKEEEISVGNNIIDSDSSITLQNCTFFIKIRVKSPNDKIYKIFSYDLNKKSLSQLQLTLINRRYVLFTDKFIVSLNDEANRLQLLDNKDGSFVHEIIGDSLSTPYKSRVNFCYPNWGLAENLSDSKLQTVYLEEKEIVGCIFLNSEIDTTEFLPPNMVFVRLWKWDATELWDMEAKCKVQMFQYPADCVIDSSRTKMIVLDRTGLLSVLHFW